MVRHVSRRGAIAAFASAIVAAPALAQTAHRYDVRSAPYGASGNGSDDDSAAVQRAIDAALASGGGTVYFPAGTYALGRSHLRLTANGRGRNIRLEGEGADRTTIVQARPNGGCIYDVGEHDGLSLSGLTFDAGGFHRNDCIVLGTVHDLTIDGCTFRNTLDHHGVTIGLAANYYKASGRIQSTNAVVRNCRFERLRGAGFEALVFSNVDGGALTNCTFAQNDSHAGCVFLYTYCFNFTIQGNLFDSPLQGTDIIVTNSSDVTISNNRHLLDNPIARSIAIENARNVIIEREQILGRVNGRLAAAGIFVFDWSDAIDGHPILFESSQNITVRNSVIRDTYQGIVVPPRPQSSDELRRMSNIRIDGNTFEGQVASAIQIGNPSVEDLRAIVVSDNRIQLPRSHSAAAIDVIGNKLPPVSLTLMGDVNDNIGPMSPLQSVPVSTTAGVTVGERLRIGTGEDAETIGVSSIAGGQIVARFKKPHRANSTLTRAAAANGGLSDISIVGNTILAPPYSSSSVALRVEAAQVSRVAGNNFSAAPQQIDLRDGARIVTMS